MRSSRLLLLISVLFLSVPIWAQQVPAPLQAALPQPPTEAQGAQAASLLQQSVAAQTAGAAINDVTLTGTVTSGRTPTKAESGTITLTALARGQSQVVINLPSGPITIVENYSTTSPAGTSTGPDGVPHKFQQQSLKGVHPAWFFPAFIAGAGLSSSDLTKSAIGLETWNGIRVQHVAVWKQPAIKGPNEAVALMQRLSERDLYLDASSLLPVAMTYDSPGFSADPPSVKPYRQGTVFLHKEIRFSDYRLVQGHPVAFHIQAYGNKTLVYDIQISSVSLNTGAVIAGSN